MSVSVTIIRSIGGFQFDATFQETHESVLQVTDNPVETGVVVSDHAFMDPLKVTISAGVSDVMLTDNPSDQFASDGSRSKKAYELLTQLQAAAEPFDVQTGLKLYKNMLCTSIRTSQDKDTANVLVFEACLREVITVETQIVKYPPRKNKQATAKKQKGEKQGEQVTAVEKKQSLTKKLVDLLGGLGK